MNVARRPRGRAFRRSRWTPRSGTSGWAGFGASITDSSARLIASSPHRDAIMRDCSTRGGLGLSYLRQPMGASDFVAGAHYTYDDVPPGRPTTACAHFSIAHDEPRSCRCCARPARSTPA